MTRIIANFAKMTQNNSDYDLEKEEYYILDEKEEGKSAPEHEEEEDAKPDGEEPRKERKRPNPVLLLFSMMTNPVEGWKKIRRARMKPEEVASRCFYPLTALAAVSEFLDYIYGTPEAVNEVLIQALTVFISFFFGYFLVMILEKTLLPTNCREISQSNYGKEYAMYLLSTLTLFYTLSNCLPMLEAVWVFLPLWTIYLASKGIRFFKFPDERTTLLTVLMCSFIILSPIAVYMLFTELLLH